MLKFSANLSFLYTEVPFLERFAAAARDGFRAVEYVSPYGAPAAEIAALLATHGLEQALFNLPAGNWDGGERGIGCLPDRTEEFRAGIDTAIAYATALGCRKVNCLAGIAPQGVAEEVLEATLVANLAYAAPRLAAAGVKLLVEPINTRDIPGFFVSTTHHAERLLAAVGSSNLFIQYDIYHTQVMQGDLVPTYARLRDRIGHIQIADNPGRNEPGTGEINYGFVLSEIDRLGYDGWIGCEYRPKAGTSAGLGWMRHHG
ncbi:hydroxypyruvate isomerase [Devosia sp.]|uniref:hydroxypyruvate isomerase n=1 Tax=Devosia sp. TaxID=1871048 RepID=UPI0035B30113